MYVCQHTIHWECTEFILHFLIKSQQLHLIGGLCNQQNQRCQLFTAYLTARTIKYIHVEYAG